MRAACGSTRHSAAKALGRGAKSRLLLPAAALVLLPVAEFVAGVLPRLPAGAGGLDGGGVLPVEEVEAAPIFADPLRYRAVGQHQTGGAVRILVLGREPDRLALGPAIAFAAMRQEGALLIGPEQLVQ